MELHGLIEGEGPRTLLVAHGLLGAAQNWRSLAKRFAQGRRVIAVDMRNHGSSGRDDAMDYPAMAQDLADTLAAQGAAERADVLGHSMGGKAAMALALTQPDRVRRLIVADMAPVAYGHDHYAMLDAMQAVDLSAITRRGDADRAMAEAVPDRAMRAFLTQGLRIEDGRARWAPNLPVLRRAMPTLVGWPEALDARRFDGPALFLHGGASDYVTDAALARIRALFPQAEIEALAGAGHWLHAEQPEAFAAAALRFLDAP